MRSCQLFLVAVNIGGASQHQPSVSNKVHIPSGIYEGLATNGSDTIVYYNVRYAEGTRFQPPAELQDTNNDTLVNATSPGPAYIKFSIPGEIASGLESLLGTAAGTLQQIEDCLSMDIHVPKGQHTNLPVLFYIPGDGFVVGYSGGYDMRPVIDHSLRMSKPMIGIVINYRLGPFGFLNPSTATEDQRNVGLTDQAEALKFRAEPYTSIWRRSG